MTFAIKTSKTRARYDRRAFLKGIGASAALVPLLGDERHALAEQKVQRLVTAVWPNGVARPHFYPKNNDPTSGQVMESLRDLTSKVSIVAGMDCSVMLDDGRKYDGHFSYPSLFTGTYRNVQGQNGTATGPSLDQVVADHIAQTETLALPIFNAGAHPKSTSFAGDNQRNTGETQPRRMFDNVFKSRAMPSDAIEATRRRRASILDFVQSELKDFRRRVGADNASRLDAHTDAIRRLEDQLGAGNQPLPDGCNIIAPNLDNNLPFKNETFVDLAALAFRCDLSRVATLTLGDNGGSFPTQMPWLGNEYNVNIHNIIAHGGPAEYDRKIVVDQYYIGLVARLATAMNNVDEGDGSMLDNSAIVVMSDMNEGATHDVGGGIPTFTVGSAGGKLATGKVIKVGDWGSKGDNYWGSETGVPNNHLLNSVAAAFGVPDPAFGANKYQGRISKSKSDPPRNLEPKGRLWHLPAVGHRAKGHGNLTQASPVKEQGAAEPDRQGEVHQVALGQLPFAVLGQGLEQRNELLGAKTVTDV